MSALLKRDAIFPDPSPLADREVYMAAAGRAVDVYGSFGAIVITEELHDTPKPLPACVDAERGNQQGHRYRRGGAFRDLKD